MACLLRHCRSLDQRFAASEEDEFKQSLEAGFVIPMRTISVVTVAACVMGQSIMGADVGDRLKRVRLAQHIALVLVALLTSVTVVLRKRIPQRDAIASLESVAVVMGTVVIVVVACGQLLYFAQHPGEDPRRALGNEAASFEMIMVMTASIVGTLSCLIVPIRSHVSWVLPAWGFIVVCVISYVTSSPSSDDLPIVLTFLGVSSGVSVRTGWRIESYMRKDWLAQCEPEKEKEPDMSDEREQGYVRILGRLCTGLLELGPRYDILPASQNLPAMLSTTAQSLPGTNFAEYCASPEDRIGFLTALRGSTAEGLAGMCTLCLRDALGRVVTVNIYHTSFKALDGSSRYIIGVAPASALEALERVETTSSASSHTIESDDSSAESVDSFVSGSDISLASAAGSDLGAMSVTFDDSAMYKIITCSPAFTAICGPSGDSSRLIDWIVDGRRFTTAAKCYIKCFSFARRQNFTPFVLRTPSASQRGVDYMINTCMIDDISAIMAYERGNQRISIQLRLNNITKRRSRTDQDRCSESTGNNEEHTLESVAGSELGEISVTFDDSEVHNIMTCTPGFAALYGPVGDSPQLIDRIDNRQHFALCVKRCVRAFLSAQRTNFAPLVLRTPTSKRIYSEYIVYACTVEAMHVVNGDDPSDQRFAIRLRLDNIRSKRSPALRRGGKRRREMRQWKAARKVSL
mmetsp:Transcript_51856/g.144874  ORF Transcript_51856/g.144874 Transcript_51856/m.144874 type:complete len:689 (-) Transcript_51856:89-2155(-)